MTTETRLKRKEIESLSLAQIVDDERVKQRFVELYNARTRTQEGMSIYVQATESFMRSIQEDKNLQECTPLSLYNAFLDMAFYGLTVSKQAQPLAYLLWNNVNAGTKDKPAYEKRATLAISPYGELSIRQAMGQIKYADNPIIVYEDDEYSGVYYKNGEKAVDYKKNMKSKNKKIVAAFIKLVRSDGTADFEELDLHKVQRLAGYSNRKNFNKGANALYTSNDGQIDEGFLIAKLTKHAFNAYPRVNNTASSAVFESEKTEVEEAVDIYELEEDEGGVAEVYDAQVQDPIDGDKSF